MDSKATLAESLGTTSDYKLSSRQCLVLSTSFYRSYCETSAKSSHDLSDNVRRIQQPFNDVDETPTFCTPFRESTNSRSLASLKLSGHKDR